MTKGHGDTFGVDGYVQSIESGDGFTGVDMSTFIKLYPFSMCSLLCTKCISIEKIQLLGWKRKKGM